MIFEYTELRETVKKKYKSYLIDNTLRKRFVLGAFWSLVSSILPSILGVIGAVFIARIIGKIRYGELGIIRSTMETFAVYAGLGFGVTATKYIAEFRNLDKIKSGRIIGLTTITGTAASIIMAAASFIFSPYIATRIISAPHLVDELRLASLFLFITGLNGVQNGIISGFEAFKDLAKVSIYVGIINFILTIIFVYYWGLYGAIISLVSTRVFQWIINHQVLRKIMKRENIQVLYSGIKNEMNVIWKFSIPAIISGSITGPVLWITNTILVNQPNGYAEMGIFSAANQWRNYLMLFPSVIGQVVIPILSERCGIGDLKSVKKTIRISVLLNMIATLPIALILIIYSKRVMGIYGSDFSTGWAVFIMVLLYTILLALQTPVGQIITARGKMWVGFLMNVSWGAVLIISFAYFKKYGALGLSASFLIAYSLHLLWTYLYTNIILTKSKLNS